MWGVVGFATISVLLKCCPVLVLVITPLWMIYVSFALFLEEDNIMLDTLTLLDHEF